MAVTLFQRSGSYWLNVSHRGQRERRPLKTRDGRIAERIRREVESRLLLGQYKVQPARVPFSQFRAGYLDHARLHKRPRTVDNDERFLDILEQELHPVDLGDVTTEGIEALKRRCLKRGHSSTTINMMLRHLSAAFGHAVKQGHLAENPVKKVSRVRVESKPPRFLTQEQVRKVLEVAEQHGRDIQLVFALGIYAGLRRLEIVNARWEWFDFDRGVITVTGRGDFQLKGRRFRTVPLHTELKRILEPQRQAEGFLFSPEREEHRGHYRYDFKQAFGTVIREAGVPWVTPHILRHTFASQLAIAGVSLYKISQWLGHRSITTTMIYSHLQAQDDDINRLAAG
jgi:integrase